MDRQVKIYILVIFTLFLINCEKTVYYHDRTDPSFTYEPNFTKLTDSSATIYWSTNEPCKSSLKYFFEENRSYPDTIIFSEFRQQQKITLEKLWPNVIYSCLIEIYDFENNGPLFSDTLKFRTVSNGVSEAWDLLNNNQIENAAITIDNWMKNKPNNPQILFTKAWVELKKGNLELANTKMMEINFRYPDFLAAYAGLVVVNHILQEYNSVTTYANKLLQMNAFWAFAYPRTDLNYKYVRLMLAEAYLNTGFIKNAQEQLDLVWPDNRLDEDLKETWIIDGVQHENYESALISVIKYLYRTL